jgi:hypothetical protein
MKIESIDWVYERLICEFDHWDICLQGLIHDEGNFKFVEINIAEKDRAFYLRYKKNIAYCVYDINWNNECTAYLADYELAYPQWFYENGIRRQPNKGDILWFYDKWRDNNLIENAVVKQ